MRKSGKKEILGLINNMKILHTMLAGSGSDLLTDYLSTCQQAAISVGDFLEKDLPKGLEDMICVLERYAERCYEITVQGQCTAEDVKRLDDLADDVTDKIEQIPVKLQIAFFPYKAEMWDSLESIYIAAAADPDCEVRVVPIPYYEMDQTVGKWVPKYDGGRFHLGIPVEYYKEYDVKTEQPDVAYIHNPYDNFNLVTSVEPAYYSFELKKYVGKLVYVPYYVNAGKLSNEHKNLSCYQHVDYIVLQSKQAKEDCRGLNYYDKILPLGSPKLDRVIRKCKQGASIPESWEHVINGRRTLMLNSTLAELLSFNEKVLIKFMNLFRFLCTYKEIAIIWRPHPLYEATIRAMRPMLLQQYIELKSFFVDNGIGVLDTTPDISTTVAVADGYIGSSGSSVINLFAAAGKPIFLFNNAITEVVPREEAKVLGFDFCSFAGDKFFAYSHYPDCLFEISLDNYTGTGSPTIRPITTIAKDKLYTYPYWYMTAVLGKLYFSPTAALELAQYDPEKGTVKNIHSDKSFEQLYFYWLLPCDDTVFLMTARNEMLAEYGIRRHKWIYHKRGLELLLNSETGPNAEIKGYTAYKRTAYFSTGITNRILKISAGTGKAEVMDLGTSAVTKDLPVFLLGASSEGLWLEICSNAYRTPGTVGVYLAPWECLGSIKDWRYFPLISGTGDRYENTLLVRFFSRAYDIGGYMVICPGRYEHIFRINRKSGEISLLAEDFWESLPEGHSLEAKAGVPAIREWSVAADEKHILVQRVADKRMALINVSDDTFTEFIPQLRDEDFEAILKENEGFRKDGQDGYFAMRESDMYSLQYFLNQFAESGWGEIRERQMKALESFAENLDGSCGEKVHAFVKKTFLEAEKG